MRPPQTPNLAAQERLVSRETVVEVPLAGLSFSFITQQETIRKILTHQGEPVGPPHVSPARGPPVDWDDLVQADDDSSLHQASPEDVPMIDIHRR